MSTRTRLTLQFTALFSAIVIALAIGAFIIVKNTLYRELDAALYAAIDATAMSAQHEIDEHPTELAVDGDLQSVLSEQQGNASAAAAQILIRQGDRIVAFTKAREPQLDLRFQWPRYPTAGSTAGKLRVVFRDLPLPKFATHYQIYAAAPVAPTLKRLERVGRGLLFVALLGLAAAASAGYFLASKSLKPLQELAETIRAISSSDLSARVKVKNPKDEIGRLGSQFNQLLTRLEQAFALQRRFMADASHELRTPVTVAITAAQVTKRNPNRARGDYEETLDIIEEELLRQAILILLDNAVKFTPAKGKIELAIERRGALWVCSVTDSGSGIPIGSQSQIFERFFRAEQPGGVQQTAGSGLGLSIAKSIMEAHNGTVNLVHSRPGFTRFEIALPALDGTESANQELQANSLAVRM
ncbi:MAG: ATP-binding protein [Acidobacteriota bacterium]|nr:ATP-binding protein [Acidobacteriota bacterium]